MPISHDLPRIVADLTRLGCNERESKIYVQCLQLGSASVQQIASKLGQNRLTVHSAVGQMIKKGFLFETRKGKKRLIVAEEPVTLLRLVHEREQDVANLRGNVEHLVSVLSSLQSTDRSIPTVKLFEGVEGFKRMLEETLSARGEILVFSNVDLFSRLVGEEHLEKYFRRRARKGIHTRLIFPPCSFADRVAKRSKEFKIQVRLLKTAAQWKTGIFSWNDCIAIMSYTEQKLTCTIIENRDIASFFRNINFDVIWKHAEPPSVP
ncbi:MAG: helix-turn-helix domain-containing protein [Candidatus Peregrinibacteria bacterium]|nr:helix-turn-helix domain-containing protein [Candidatus Peregrinibacteria bacterium]